MSLELNLQDENNLLRQRIQELETRLSQVQGTANQAEILFRNMAQGVVYQSAEGEIIAANPAAEKILGLTVEQMRGRKSTDAQWSAQHADGTDFPGDQHPAMQALRSGIPVTDVVMGVYNPRAKTRSWLLVSAFPQFQAEKSTPTLVCTTFTDITSLKILKPICAAAKNATA